MESWRALLPFLIVIPISILTKQVIPGLFLGLLTGSYLIEPTPLGGIKKLLYYSINNLTKSNNIRVIIFLYLFAGLINIIKLTGGIKGFVHLISNKIKTKKSAFAIIWLSILGTFSAPNLRIITVAPIIKSLQKELNLSSKRLAFAIGASSSPVVALVPIATAFVGYMVSVVQFPLQKIGVEQNPYAIYIRSIPFNFFSFVIILVGLYFSFFKENNNKQKTEKQNKDPKEKCLQECKHAYTKETPVKPWNLILPLITTLFLTIFLTWWDGYQKAPTFLGAFIASDVLGAMLQGLVIALLLSIIFFKLQNFSLKKIITSFIEGGNNLMSVIILLTLIWGLTEVSGDLGFSKYIIANIGDLIPTYFVAPVIFLLGALISYFIGSSWGTWGLLMPLGVTLAHNSGTNILLTIGAVFSSGTFGAFASPLSDNANTLCTILNIPIIEYTRYKLIPALTAAGITAILFGVASFIVS
ncbi:Na+/H+ antiporter [Halobacteroides halobius DSM 5150]|uniref:Na+/H+ antiporter n=1 Tax=Halobacteroides halobius (strain ATCC 35273 / DSM 5150 / MD-1) TaxID=748449 RepID=L0K8N7_HALHC|nr:Na+/H+ antiporter NhaC family protein [Halobacteroides halobius]AGB40724.1 Na+/H+ antiporter [Halobacteroides halobius DSM 5150]